jgi:sulfite exporter TauE/SafE
MSGAANLVAFGAGALAGLASSAHCAGMCGPLAAHACRARGGTGAWEGAVAYQGGRLLAYPALGALAGGLGHGLTLALPERVVQALLSWSLAVALGVASWRAFRASRPADASSSRSSAPVALGHAPRRPSLAERLFARTLDAPFALGVVTALLPCGALATGLLVAAGSGAPTAGALAMMGFALASGPALLVAAFALDRVAREAGPGGLRLAALALALGAVVLAVRPLAGLRHGGEAVCHGPSVSVNSR